MGSPFDSSLPMVPEVPPLPAWANENISISQMDRAFSAGARLAAISALLRAEPPYLGALSERLAFQAAAATNRSSGRPEDEDEIRDQWLLRPREEDLPQAAQTLACWLRLPRQQGGIQALRPDVIEALAVGFGRPLSEPVEDTLRSVQSGVRHASNPVEAAARASAAFFRQEPRHEAIAHFLSDVVLAERLGWRRPLPLLALSVAAPVLRAGGVRRRPLPNDPDWEFAVFGAYALSASRAYQLASYLSGKAMGLVQIAPRLRAKRSDKVVEALLSHAFLPGSRSIAGMTDRGMRRIFDRLVAVGAVREVSGRATFRIYGL